MRFKTAIVAATAVLAALTSLSPAAAQVDGVPSPTRQVGPPLGIVPPHSQGDLSKLGGAGGNLSYHNGPVMQTNTTYAIYWVPAGYSVSGNYESLINGYFSNVQAAAGTPSNDVYVSDTEYYGPGGGKIQNKSTFSGSYVDTNTFPASGCTDSYTSVCLTDGQLANEIVNVAHSNGWATSPTSIFFVFTPKNVGSCSGNSCAFTQYCAYHSWTTDNSGNTLNYANMPYAAWVSGACGSGQSPNGDDADSTINVISHEHNETITDEHGSAWFDRRGYEDGDKCAWNFGTALGSTSTGKYNQVIGSGKYYLQQEWSNQHSGCILSGT